jgi:Uma2 family endonuclease
MELMTLDMNRRYSFADYLTWWDDKRRELFDGIVHMMSPASALSHATIVGNLYADLNIYIRNCRCGCRVFTAPFDVRLPQNGEKENDKIYTVVQPDICLVCDPGKLDECGCIGAPEMIVEVLSPSTLKRDMNDKYRIYETAGVKEYWTVATKDKSVIVFLLQENGKYAEGIVYDDKSSVPVQSLPGLEINAEELFRY